MTQGRRVPEVAEIVGYNAERVRQIARHYNTEGPASLADRRAGHSGRRRLLTAREEKDLQNEVEDAFAQGQPYTRVQVARRMSEMLGREVYPARGWELLQRWVTVSKFPDLNTSNGINKRGKCLKKT